MAEAAHVYALGRDCVLQVDGTVLNSADNVLVREVVTSMPATPRNSSTAVSIPIQRTLEVSVSLLGGADITYLLAKRQTLIAGYLYPNVVTVSLSGGVFNATEYFTIHDIAGDEPLNSAVSGRFEFRQWSGVQAGRVGTALNAYPASAGSPSTVQAAATGAQNPAITGAA